MKKPFAFMLVVIMICVSVACSPQTSYPTETQTPASQVEGIVMFTDPVLEKLIRSAMDRPDGDITLAEAEAVTELDLEMQGDAPLARVADVSDLTQFQNLTALNLNWALSVGDGVVDISPLASLTKLERLYVCCCNINDISALADMTDMKDLWIWGNNISDISPLAGMTQMESMWIKNNQISDISVLANMKNLVYLYMENNMVEDLSPLSELSELTYILTSGNPATDYSPLAGIYPNLEEKDFEIK